MNKIALCYSGSTRTFEYCVKNHAQIFENCDVFVSTWDKPQRLDRINSPDYKKINLNVPEKITEKYIKDLMPDQFNLVDIRVDEYNENLIKKNNATNHSQLSFQYFKIKDCFDLLKKSGMKYDFVVRIRMDITIENCFFSTDKICVPHIVWYNYPFGQRQVNEMIWTCNQELMEKTTLTYDNLEKIQSTHGEAITYESFCMQNLQEKLQPQNFNYMVIR